MSRFVFRLVVVGMALAIAAIGVTADPFGADEEGAPKGASVRIASWTAEVVSVDPAAGALTVTAPGEGGARTVLINDASRISGAGPGDYTDLVVGAPISLEGQISHVTANSLRVGDAPDSDLPFPGNHTMEMRTFGGDLGDNMVLRFEGPQGEGGPRVVLPERMLRLQRQMGQPFVDLGFAFASDGEKTVGGASVSLDGKIVSRDPLTIETEEGERIRVDLAGDATVTAVRTYALSDLSPGDAVRIVADESDDGVFTARAVDVKRASAAG